MGIYYNEVEEAIRNNERELRHLQEELKGLRSVEKDTPWDSYQRQEAQIRRHMATEESRLEGNKSLLNNYKLAQESFRKLEELRRLRGKERDSQIRREIDEEIVARERELESSMGGLTDELRQELKDDFDNMTSKSSDTELAQMTDSPETEIEKGKEKVKKVGKTENSNDSTEELIYRTHYENGMEYHEDDESTTSTDSDDSDDETTTIDEEDNIIDTPTTDTTKDDESTTSTDSEDSDDEITTTVDEEPERKTSISPEELMWRAHYENGMEYHEDDTETTTDENEITDTKEEDVITTDKTQNNTGIEEDLDKRRARVSAEYEQAEADYQAALRRMQEIFKEEREEKERIGVISTESELDAFYDNYMQQKVKQNEIIEAARKRRDNAQTSLKMIDTLVAASTPMLALPPHEGNKVLPPRTRGNGGPQNGEYEIRTIENIPQPVYAPPQVEVIEVEAQKDNPEDYEIRTIENIPQPVYAPPQIEVIEVEAQKDNPEDYEIRTIENIPQPVYAPPQVEVTEVVETVPTKKGLITIFDELTQGLSLGAKDGKRYKAANIKIAKEFKDELNSGNYLYNLVHLVPAIVKLPFQLLRKVSGKIMFGAKAKRNAETLKRRLNALPQEELMTIYEEYSGNKALQERYPTIMNTLIDERMQRFALEAEQDTQSNENSVTDMVSEYTESQQEVTESKRQAGM